VVRADFRSRKQRAESQIGHFVSDLPVAGGAGVRPYIYVDHRDATLEKIVAHGGEIDATPYPEGDLCGWRPFATRPETRSACGSAGHATDASDACVDVVSDEPKRRRGHWHMVCASGLSPSVSFVPNRTAERLSQPCVPPDEHTTATVEARVFRRDQAAAG
jgi:hypothetical protein